MNSSKKESGLILFRGSRGNHAFSKTEIMLARAKEMLIADPKRRVLLVSKKKQEILSYDAGSKVFVYSAVKEPAEPEITFDELARL